MLDQHAVNLGHFRQREMLAGCQIMADLAEYPRPALRSAADHDRIGPGVFEHLLGLLRRVDVAVGDDRNAHCGLYRGDGVVLGMSRVGASAGAAVHGQRLDARALGDARDCERIFMLRVPAGADLQRHRHVYRAHHGIEYPANQRLVLQQRRARHHVADFLGRAAHVDVDDLRACATL